MRNPYNELVCVGIKQSKKERSSDSGHGSLPHSSTSEFFQDVATVTARTVFAKMGIERLDGLITEFLEGWMGLFK